VHKLVMTTMAKRTLQSVTVSTIAQRVGVAPCTVSSVLNGQAKKRRIQEKTANRILEEAQRLNYVPNELARGLRSRHSGVLGLVVAGLENDWAERILLGVNQVSDAEGYLPMLLTHRWIAERERRGLVSLQQRRVDGIITIPLPECAEDYRRTARRGVPVVFLGDALLEAPEISYVAWDKGPAVHTAVRHLVEAGGRRIGFIALERHTALSAVRLQAFEQELARAGLVCEPQWIQWVRQEADVRGALQRMYEGGGAGPDAIFAGDDGIALQVLAELYRMGLRVPQNVLLAGMGDLWKGDEMGAGLTTVREPCEEIGRLAAETVLELLQHPQRAPIRKLVPGVELKVRRSTMRQQA
jgi:LacI family transcriptional regulator